MQLIIIILGAFGLGYWFARSETSQRLADAARDAGSRMRRKPKVEQSEAVES